MLTITSMTWSLILVHKFAFLFCWLSAGTGVSAPDTRPVNVHIEHLFQSASLVLSVTSLDMELCPPVNTTDREPLISNKQHYQLLFTATSLLKSVVFQHFLRLCCERIKYILHAFKWKEDWMICRSLSYSNWCLTDLKSPFGKSSCSSSRAWSCERACEARGSKKLNSKGERRISLTF